MASLASSGLKYTVTNLSPWGKWQDRLGILSFSLVRTFEKKLLKISAFSLLFIKLFALFQGFTCVFTRECVLQLFLLSTIKLNVTEVNI